MLTPAFLPIVAFGMPNMSEMLIILVIIMIFFGAGRLPDVLKQFGKGVKEFKDASEGLERKGGKRSGFETEDEEDGDDDERAAFEEFKRKRRETRAGESKQIAKDARPNRTDPTAVSTPGVTPAPGGDDADGDGDNDDFGSVPASKSRSRSG